MIKVFKANKSGKVELTEEELEDLLKESYDEGYRDGYNVNKVAYPYYPNTTPVNPSYPGWWNWPYITWTCSDSTITKC